MARAGVGGLEARRHHVVELDGAELPRAADRVGHVEVDLRTVERPLALPDPVLEPAPPQSLSERVLGVLPGLIRTEPVFRPGGELDPRLESEQLVEVEAEVEAAQHLVLDLLLGAEDVRVVLGELAHAQETMERPAWFMAVDEPLLCQPNRQLAI